MSIATGIQPHLQPHPRYTAMRFANGSADQLATLSAQYPVLGTMLDLVDIPSSTPQPDPKFAPAIQTQMDRMRARTVEKLKAAGVQEEWIEHDPLGSLIVRIPGSAGLEDKQPLLLTAHMDIVAGDEHDPTRQVHPTLVNDADGNPWVATDGTTTLGADDKGGMSMILDNVARILGHHPLQQTPIAHAPLEIIFSPDEESTLESLKRLDTSKFKAKHVLVVDEFDAFKVTTGLASAVPININISGFPGGHSGDDIDKGRPNAIMALNNLLRKIGTGVIAMMPDNSMPIISKNIAMIKGGRAPNAIPENAQADVFLRSGNKDMQDAELARMQKLVDNAQRYYRGHGAPDARIDMQWHEEYPAWEGDPNTPIKDWAIAASKDMQGPNVEVGAVHAAAQASILANMKNASGEPFDAVLIGPKIEGAHTVKERCNVNVLVEANRWLGGILQEYAKS